MSSSSHAEELQAGKRFAFGRNWSRFISSLREEQIGDAVRSLQVGLELESLSGRSFLDLGSGSGLFSLAARRLGARVHSIDYDPVSVACTRELRERFAPGDAAWTVEQASILDTECTGKLGRFNVVYAWGVLHHTGQMFKAFENTATLVLPAGQLFISIYNNQGWLSRYWNVVKRIYNQGFLTKAVVIALHAPYVFGARYALRAVTGRLRLERGMSMWRDTLDWLGGYPFETATPETVFAFFRQKGFALTKLKTCRGRMGCNEFVFRRSGDT